MQVMQRCITSVDHHHNDTTSTRFLGEERQRMKVKTTTRLFECDYPEVRNCCYSQLPLHTHHISDYH